MKEEGETEMRVCAPLQCKDVPRANAGEAVSGWWAAESAAPGVTPERRQIISRNRKASGKGEI